MKKSAFINILTALIMLTAVFFTFSAAVYAKFDGSSTVWAYVMLYCGSFVLPVIWNAFSKLVLKNRTSRAVDITQLSVAVIALAILIIWGGKHDIWLMIPWNLLIILSLALLIIPIKQNCKN